MNLDERKKKLDALIARRDTVSQNLQRVHGRLDSARKDLADIDAECRAKSLDPEKLEETLKDLLDKYDNDVRLFEDSIKKAEQDLAPFLNI